jgi:hypothetical protein
LTLIDLADLLVHSNGAHHKSAIVVAFGQPGETLDRLGDVSDADVEIAQSIDERKVRGIFLDQFLVFSDRMADFPLNNVLLSRF